MGPLAGMRVIELAGLGPVPFAAMLLADMGADVVRIDRVDGAPSAVDAPAALSFTGTMLRGRRSIAMNLKAPAAVEIVGRMVASADALIEGFRPGVMERLGLGPEQCLVWNPALVYARMTGYGQDGPLSQSAGHDANYLSVAGVLAHIGPRERPIVPLSLVGDFGGGAMFLVAGVLAAIVHAREHGDGQVVDVSVADGAAMLMSPFYDFFQNGVWSGQRESNFGDGGAPYYRLYLTRDDEHVSVAAVEPKFYADLLTGLGLAQVDLPDRNDEGSWPLLAERLASVFRTRTRSEWLDRFATLDACVAPVLTMAEAPTHPHNVARRAFQTIGSTPGQPAPAPRFGRTPSVAGRVAPAGAAGRGILAELGYSTSETDALVRDGVIGEVESIDGG